MEHPGLIVPPSSMNRNQLRPTWSTLVCWTAQRDAPESAFRGRATRPAEEGAADQRLRSKTV
jgi:hypothetical protein